MEGGFSGATSKINHTHSRLQACPTRLFFNNLAVCFDVQAEGFFIAFHEIFFRCHIFPLRDEFGQGITPVASKAVKINY
jgi:hypothetical protein